jgi:hypothetical protein
MLKYYKLPSIKGEGWAHISLNTDTGFFATVSDWGNYSYIWDAPGGEFRHFLLDLRPDYLYGKLMMGRPDSKVFDGAKTVENVRLAIEEKNAEEEGHWPHYREELEALSAIGRDPEKSEFEGWESETRLTDVWEYAVYVPAPDCMGFCTKVWPRFVELLKKELYDEKKGHEEAEILKAAKPAILAEARADIERMTGPDRNG